MMPETMRQTQDPRHVATAHLSRRFAYLTIEFICLLDDQNACVGPFAFEHECRRRTGEGAADNYDVIIEIRRSKSDGLHTVAEQAAPGDAAILSALERRPLCRQDCLHYVNDFHQRSFDFSRRNSGWPRSHRRGGKN